jgi:hypothetical protein
LGKIIKLTPSFLQLQIPNLTTEMTYEVKIQAATISALNPKKLVLGAYSILKEVSKCGAIKRYET